MRLTAGSALLLDTHILVRWIAEPKRLSKEQARLLRLSTAKRQPVGISAMTLVEIAMLAGAGRVRLKLHPDAIFRAIDESPAIEVLPITLDIARDITEVGKVLPDPADRTIVATARMHGLRLLSSDQRIVEAQLVSVVD